MYIAAFWEQFSLGGNLLLLVIAGCSILAMTIFIERLLFLRRAETDTNHLILALRDSLQVGDLPQAIATCEQTGGAIATILRTGLLKYRYAKEEIEGAMEIAGLAQIALLEKNAKVLSIIAHIAPLIGLLGTVVGFIQAFSEMRMSGLVDISATRLGEAMEFALITTAAGLVVAIPCVIAYNYIVSRVERFVLEIQMTAAEIVDLIMHHRKEWS